MPRKRNPMPSYLLHQRSGQARVRLGGKEINLGVYGSAESRKKYAELVAQWSSGLPVEYPGDAVSVAGLVRRFMDFAKGHYVNGARGQVAVFRSAFKPLVELHAATPAAELGPVKLKEVRARMVDLGWARKTINLAIGRIRQLYRWGVENELLEPSAWERLRSLTPLVAGRTMAPESVQRRPVEQAAIELVKAEVSPLVSDLIDLQLSTGARSGELVALTVESIDTTGPVWRAQIVEHKTAHRGKERWLYFGPRAQAVLFRNMTGKRTGLIFTITRTAYCRAITRACARLGIPRWVPHQLRHTAGTLARERFGLDHAQALLGHSSASMTEHYAAVTEAKAVEVAAALG